MELRILKRLFTVEEAQLALHTTMIPEEAKVIARRAKLTVKETVKKLDRMEQKGLIFSIKFPKKPKFYMAAQYVIGIWEYQVDKLDPELIKDMNEYLPTFVDLDIWKKAPQLRTIPVKQSLESSLEVMPYERAENLVRKQKKLRVVPCICRREHRIVGEGCDKPEEACLVFGMAAYYYENRGVGREIDVDECLKILKLADKAGLVLQPNNAQKLYNICCCCGCCCQVLIHIGKHPKPAELVSSPFIASLEEETCENCEVCITRCQMKAISKGDENVKLNPDRCIGCGLCVTTCPTKSFTLIRKPSSNQPHVPANMIETQLQLGRARNKLGSAQLLKMSLKSKWHRMLAK